MGKKSFLVFFCFLLLLAETVSAAVPTVDFFWQLGNDQNGVVAKNASVTFIPLISSNLFLNRIAWNFPDSNIGGDFNRTYVSVQDFNDDFSDGNFLVDKNWIKASVDGWGNFSLGANKRLKGEDQRGDLKSDFNFSYLNKSFVLEYDMNLTDKGGAIVDSVYFFLGRGIAPSATIPTGYFVEMRDGAGTIVFYRTDGATTSLLINSGLTTTHDQVYSIRLERKTDGNFSLFVDDDYKGSAVDTTYTDFNFFDLNIGFSGSETVFSVDNIFFSTMSTTSDKNEMVEFPTIGAKSVCLTAGNNDGNATICKSATVSLGSPTILNFDFNYLTGFGFWDVNEHFVLRCDSNFSSNRYQLYFNDVNVFDQNVSDNSYQYIDVNANAGTNTARFICTASDSSTTQTKTVKLYAITFRIVNERTGLPITTFADFNRIRLTDFDLNKHFDFNSASGNQVAFSSLSTDTLRLDINYSDSTELFKEYSMAVITDRNISLCVAQPAENFAQQIIVSSIQTDQVVIQHSFSNCYALAALTRYAYQNNFSAQTFTINSPYSLYFFDDGVKTLLSTLDGSTGLITNLRAMILNRTQYTIDIARDTVGIAPLRNALTGEYDTNIMQFYYYALRQNNAILLLCPAPEQRPNNPASIQRQQFVVVLH